MLSALCFHNRIASGSLQWPDWSRHRRCGNCCCFKEKYSRYIGTEVRARDNALAAGWGQSLIVNNSAFLLRLNDTDTTANMNVSFNAHLTFTVAPVYAAFILYYYIYLHALNTHSWVDVILGKPFTQESTLQTISWTHSHNCQCKDLWIILIYFVLYDIQNSKVTYDISTI